MKFNKFFYIKIFFVLLSSQLFFNVSKANSAEEIKIIYSLFSRTIKVNSLKTFAEKGNSTNFNIENMKPSKYSHEYYSRNGLKNSKCKQ